MGIDKEKKREYDRKYNQSERGKQKRKEQKARWYKKNKERIREYQRKWKEENKDKVREYQREWCKKNKERRKEYYIENREHFNELARQYYKENKEKVYKCQQEYFARNRKKITKLMLTTRKRNANKFKEQGQMYCYLHKTERQNRMVQRLCRKTGLSLEESRRLLEERNWNIKSILEKTVEIYDVNNNLIAIVQGTKELSEYLGCTRRNADTILRENKKRARNKNNKTWIYIVERKDNNEYSRAI